MSRRRTLNLPSVVSQDQEQDELFNAEIDEAPGSYVLSTRDQAAGGSVVAELTGADLSTPYTLAQLPTPYDAPLDLSSPLDEREREHLQVCESAIQGFQKALIVAGKALEVINRGRLYRETHGTFADYVADKWGMRRAHAYRLIDAWPVAAAVSPIGDINEAQARELLPVFKEHGQETTVVLFREAHDLGGGRLTAAALREVREILPPPQALTGPEQVRDVLRVAASEGRVPRLVPSVSLPAQASAEPEAAEKESEVQRGANAVAVLEAARAQQEQIYDSLAGVIEDALLYDPIRSAKLLHEIRQYAHRTVHRARSRSSSGDSPEDQAPAGTA
jgi:hypothetical protein